MITAEVERRRRPHHPPVDGTPDAVADLDSRLESGLGLGNVSRQRGECSLETVLTEVGNR